LGLHFAGSTGRHYIGQFESVSPALRGRPLQKLLGITGKTTDFVAKSDTQWLGYSALECFRLRSTECVDCGEVGIADEES
jgi:hypothetical protein